MRISFVIATLAMFFLLALPAKAAPSSAPTDTSTTVTTTQPATSQPSPDNAQPVSPSAFTTLKASGVQASQAMTPEQKTKVSGGWNFGVNIWRPGSLMWHLQNLLNGWPWNGRY